MSDQPKGEAMSEVVAVRTDTINVPTTHEHVIAVKLADGSTASCGEVVQRHADGESFSMPGDQTMGVRDCPVCGAFPCLWSVTGPQ